MNNDPLGQAILDFAHTREDQAIIVHSDLCDDDTIQSSYLFRSFNEMPILEQEALHFCTGKILDVGGGAGIHAQELIKRGLDVEAIDISPGAVKYMQSQGIKASVNNFFELDKTYDTLLFLMNGLGIAGSLENLPLFLKKAKTLLNPGGKIICDTTDIKYLYEDDEGGMWVDLGSTYYGNFMFQMEYKNEKTEWFPWLYCDPKSLLDVALKAGFSTKVLLQDNDQFLIELAPIE